jgi:hypothetical protein
MTAGLVPRLFAERSNLFETDVGNADRPSPAPANQIFHRAPCLLQRDPVTVDNVAGFAARIEVVTWLEGKRRVDQVKVKHVELKPLSTSLKRRLDSLWPMVRVPELGRDEDVLAR